MPFLILNNLKVKKRFSLPNLTNVNIFTKGNRATKSIRKSKLYIYLSQIIFKSLTGVVAPSGVYSTKKFVMKLIKKIISKVA